MSSAFAPGVAEHLAALGQERSGQERSGQESAGQESAGAPTAPVVRFLGGAARSTVIALEWPVEVDGVSIHQVTLRRLTVAEVAAFLETVAAQAADAKVTFPVFRDDQDRPMTEAVLDALDDDDATRLLEASIAFLPRRFRAASEAGSPPSAGAPTAP